ncbi:RHS repeat-associated core domain-containing protein [Hymenobacter roseosalivarius]|uniref:RHS repeat-associated core domain-containing protein n=1 Tax=Hymenobacter roseosalivarius TaxID=89967 RepID=UPI0013564DD5|nr:RHS repeat-associated core domain-containing protein [Hymenobacter roseosalivarius]
MLIEEKNELLSTAAQGGYERLYQRVFVPKAGYVQAYVANESEQEVFFDNVTVEHRQGLQVQENHYDPFGLDLVGLSRSPGLKELNQYSWNGKEKQDEFGLNWHDHGWRFYDPALGRWVVTDPDAEEAEQESWTTYQFGMDNAVRFNDLDGRCPTCPVAAAGALAGALLGGGIEAGMQLYNNGSVTNWNAVGGAALQGGITGGLAGLTAGTSLATTAAGSGLANAVGGAASNAIQGKAITVESVAKDAAIGVGSALGGALAGKAVEAAQVSKLGKTLTKLAGEAQENVTSATGKVAGQKGFGTAAHKEFQTLIDAKGLKNVATERSYLGGRVVPYGTKGSSRADVVLTRSNGQVRQVFDLKTGGAKLSDSQVGKYIKNVPGVNKANQISEIR